MIAAAIFFVVALRHTKSKSEFVIGNAIYRDYSRLYQISCGG